MGSKRKLRGEAGYSLLPAFSVSELFHPVRFCLWCDLALPFATTRPIPKQVRDTGYRAQRAVLRYTHPLMGLMTESCLLGPGVLGLISRLAWEGECKPVQQEGHGRTCWAWHVFGFPGVPG